MSWPWPTGGRQVGTGGLERRMRGGSPGRRWPRPGRARTVNRRRCDVCTGSRCSGRRHSSASRGISAQDSSGARTSCARNKEACVKNDDKDWDRRGFLQCMAWVGTGAMWTMASGVLKGMPIEQAARGAMKMSGMSGTSGLRFAQISDSHIGFDKPANTDVTATWRAALAKIKAAPEQPSFVLHTGDLTHLSKPAEFDTLQQVLGELSMPVFYVPGEHDVLDDDGKSFLQRFGKGTHGAGWYSFDQGGVHFIGLVNVVNLKARGPRDAGPRAARV